MSDPAMFEIDHDGDQLLVWFRGQDLYISVENEWAGDTEAGFGEVTSIALTHAEARAFRDWLISTLPEEV
jgi:hypothetical protein